MIGTKITLVLKDNKTSFIIKLPHLLLSINAFGKTYKESTKKNRTYTRKYINSSRTFIDS